MLKTIFGSEVRLKLLIWFCFGSSKNSYLANLVEVLEVDIKGCHRELQRLEGAKIIRSKKSGKLKIYELRRSDLSASLKLFIEQILRSLEVDFLQELFIDQNPGPILSQNYQQYLAEYGTNFSLDLKFEDIFFEVQGETIKLSNLKFSSQSYLQEIANILESKMQLLRFQNELNYLEITLEKKLNELRTNKNLFYSTKIKILFFYLISSISLQVKNFLKTKKTI